MCMSTAKRMLVLLFTAALVVMALTQPAAAYCDSRERGLAATAESAESKLRKLAAENEALRKELDESKDVTCKMQEQVEELRMELVRMRNVTALRDKRTGMARNAGESTRSAGELRLELVRMRNAMALRDKREDMNRRALEHACPAPEEPEGVVEEVACDALSAVVAPEMAAMPPEPVEAQTTQDSAVRVNALECILQSEQCARLRTWFTPRPRNTGTPTEARKRVSSDDCATLENLHERISTLKGRLQSAMNEPAPETGESEAGRLERSSAPQVPQRVREEILEELREQFRQELQRRLRELRSELRGSDERRSAWF
jgi:hypothetical protein